MRTFIFLFSFALLFLTNFDGKVIGVIDGDTIDVLKDGKPLRIRLNAIDCPEQGQAFGSAAKRFVSDLIFQKQVTIKSKGLDRYGRTIADVYLSDGTWLNKRLIDEGYAWHYVQYSDNEELTSSELKAKSKKKGLWQDPNPVPPWNFRKEKRSR